MIICKIHYNSNECYEFKSNKNEIINEDGYINPEFVDYNLASTNLFNFIKTAHKDIVKMEWGYISLTIQPESILEYKNLNNIDLDKFNKINNEFIRLLKLMALT